MKIKSDGNTYKILIRVKTELEYDLHAYVIIG